MMELIIAIAAGVGGFALVRELRRRRLEHNALVALLFSKGYATKAEYDGAVEYVRGRRWTPPAGDPPKGR